MIKKTIKRLRLFLKGKPDNQKKNQQQHPAPPAAEIKTKKNNTAPAQKRPRKKKPKWDISRFEIPPAEGKIRFHDLNLPVNIMHAIADLKFEYCTPVQAEILPKALSGRDATGQAQTGTGKSAAFLITILTRIFNTPLKGKRKPFS